MNILITLLILILIAGLLVYLVDLLLPAPYNKPAKIVIAVIVVIYLLGLLAPGLPVWRR